MDAGWGQRKGGETEQAIINNNNKESRRMKAGRYFVSAVLVCVVVTCLSLVLCGIANAGHYGANKNENGIGISGLEGHTYTVFAWPVPGFVHPCYFSFDESGDSLVEPLAGFAESYSGYYTQTGSTFTVHYEFEWDTTYRVCDLEGTSLSDIII